MAVIGSTEGKKGKAGLMFVCPCPYNECKGVPDKQQRYRFHSSPEAVRACQRENLLKHGYKQVGRREYEDPETGRILVLSRKPQRAKPGKQGRYMGKTTARVKVW